MRDAARDVICNIMETTVCQLGAHTQNVLQQQKQTMVETPIFRGVTQKASCVDGE